ncbi:MAG: M14 family metallopeptidase [Chloroflexota bacterium]
MNPYLKFLLILLFYSALLIGCAPAAEERIAEISTSIPTVIPPDTPTAIPTATRIPTITPAPINTETPVPVSTVAPLPTNTFTPLPTDTPTPEFSIISYALNFSVNGEAIEVYEFGRGPEHLILIGGIHGGYEWNTVLLMFQMIDYFTENIEQLPSNLKLSIIPVMNPDGLRLITGSPGRFSEEDVPTSTDAGRFNANGVDLNRNWNCDWTPVGYWRNQEVDAGTGPESEKEVLNVRFHVENSNPAGVIFYHSAASALYPGICNGVMADGTNEIVAAYETGSGYSPPARGGTIIGYAVTGGAADYFATKNIAAFEVELTNHQDTEFDRNLAGVLEVINFLTTDDQTPEE